MLEIPENPEILQNPRYIGSMDLNKLETKTLIDEYRYLLKDMAGVRPGTTRGKLMLDDLTAIFHELARRDRQAGVVKLMPLSGRKHQRAAFPTKS